jgi:hypothetical protein
MSRSYWLAFAAYLLPTFPLGFFWHLKTFKAAYDRLEIYRDTVLVPMGLGSMLLQAAIYAWIYPRLFDTSRAAWLSSAASFALVFGLLAWTFSVLAVAAKNRMTSVRRFVALETAFTAVQYAVVSPLVALAWRAG